MVQPAALQIPQTCCYTMHCPHLGAHAVWPHASGPLHLHPPHPPSLG